MNRFIEIINNEFLIRKQKLEQELEETLNRQEKSIDKRVDNVMKLVDKIGRISKAHEIFNSYLNNKPDGNN
jgi:hypothetical protein